MTRGRLGLVILLAFVTLGAGAQGERTGAWVDQVIFTEVPDSAAAVDLLLAGELDLYVDHQEDPQVLSTVVQNLTYQVSCPVYFELTFNPAGPEFADGRLNPFAIPAIREAVNWLIDREHIVDSFFGGVGATPRYFPVHPGSLDYQRHIETCRALEREYAPDPARARAVVTREMRALGAELVDGIWHYNGQPVEIIFLIRMEDQRREIGNYVADLLESVGFVVQRKYVPKWGEGLACWLFSDPTQGCFHIYTGGWVPGFSRDIGRNFESFYLPEGLPFPLWQGYRPAPEFEEVARRLARLDFSTLEERDELFRQALRLALEDSVRVWLVHLRQVIPYRSGLQLGVSSYGGLRYTWAWPLTLHWRREGIPQVGGVVRVGLYDLDMRAWNPVEGESVVQDPGQVVLRGTVDLPLLPDPRTGLYWPQRVERAEVVAQEGLPVVKTLGWVSLEFVPEIHVPEDAWVDWDAAAQRFITAGEKFPEALTARTKVTIHYPPEFFATHWHNGSRMSLADCLLGFIMLFDRGKAESPIYDETDIRQAEALLHHFRGLKLISQNPLVFEIYTDLVELDAEELVAYAAALIYPFHRLTNLLGKRQATFWFAAPLEAVAIGILAEAAGELAFTPEKARDLGVEQMNYLSGPTLPILERYLRQALEQTFIPYAPTLGEYITPEEARQRYQNLLAWYQEHGHLWVGNGPFYLDSLGEEQVVLKRFPDYPDPADKWLFLTQWDLPQVEIRGPERVTIGGRTGFLVDVRRNGELMPMEEVLEVRYLLTGADGEVAAGLAQPLTAGQWQVTLGPEATENLSQGEGKLIVLVFLPGCPEVPQATHTFQAVAR